MRRRNGKEERNEERTEKKRLIEKDSYKQHSQGKIRYFFSHAIFNRRPIQQ